MATSGGDPQRRKTTQGGVSGARGGAHSVLVRSEKERWSSFPMGQRLMGPSRPSSSTFLLQQIIHHRHQESEPGQEETESLAMGEEEELMDSEESSESELLNLEVCLPPHPPTPPLTTSLLSQALGPCCFFSAPKAPLLSPDHLEASPVFFSFQVPGFLTHRSLKYFQVSSLVSLAHLVS